MFYSYKVFVCKKHTWLSSLLTSLLLEVVYNVYNIYKDLDEKTHDTMQLRKESFSRCVAFIFRLDYIHNKSGQIREPKQYNQPWLTSLQIVVAFVEIFGEQL